MALSYYILVMSGVCPHLCEYATECQETHQSHVEHLPELKYEITEKRKNNDFAIYTTAQ